MDKLRNAVTLLKHNAALGNRPLNDFDISFEENNDDFPYFVVLIHKITILEDYLNNKFTVFPAIPAKQEIIDEFIQSFPERKQQLHTIKTMRAEYDDLLRQQMG